MRLLRGGFVLIGKTRYGCATTRNKGTCDAAHGIAAADLEDRVLGGLQRLLVGNEALLQAFADEFRSELERLKGSRQKDEAKLRRELAEVERELAQVQRKVEQIVEAFCERLFHVSVKDKLTSLEDRKAALQAQLQELEEEPIALHPRQAELYRRKVSALAERLLDDGTRPEAMDIIRRPTQRIEVGPPVEDRGPCRATLIGALASVLDFVSGQQNGGATAIRFAPGGRSGANSGAAEGAKQNRRSLAGSGGSVGHRTESVGTFFLVAGAGFHREILLRTLWKSNLSAESSTLQSGSGIYSMMAGEP